MIGKLLAKSIKLVTLPLDAAEIVLDAATGGDGSREGLKSIGMAPSVLRDQLAKVAEEIDDEK